MRHSPSRIVVLATQLEGFLKRSVQLGLWGMIVSGSGFLLYTVLGVIVNVLGVVRFPYPFLTLAADPIFTIGGTLVGLFVVQTAGSLLLYHFLVGFDDEKARFSVLMSFVSLGFGGALLRATLPAALEFLL